MLSYCNYYLPQQTLVTNLQDIVGSFLCKVCHNGIAHWDIMWNALHVHSSEKLKEHVDIMIFIERCPLTAGPDSVHIPKMVLIMFL